MDIVQPRPEMPLQVRPMKKSSRLGVTKYGLVHGHTIWQSQVTYEHLELDENATLELGGTVEVP